MDEQNTQNTPQPQKKQGFFSKLFGKKEETPETTQPLPGAPNSPQNTPTSDPAQQWSQPDNTLNTNSIDPVATSAPENAATPPVSSTNSLDPALSATEEELSPVDENAVNQQLDALEQPDAPSDAFPSTNDEPYTVEKPDDSNIPVPPSDPMVTPVQSTEPGLVNPAPLTTPHIPQSVPPNDPGERPPVPPPAAR